MAHLKVPEITTWRGYLIALLILVGMLVAAAWHMVQIGRFDAERAASSERVLTLFSIHQELLEAETTQRGYLLLGDADFRDAFEGSRQELLRLTDGLGTIVTRNATMAEQVARLRSLAGQRADALAQVMTVYEEQGPESARQMVRSRAGSALMERYAVLSQTVIDGEINHLNQIRDRTARSNTILNILLVTGLGLILFMAMLGIGGKQRDLRQQRALADRLKSSGKKITQLNELNNQLLSCRDHTEAYEVISRGMQRLFPGTSGGVYAYRASRDVLELQVTWGAVRGTPLATILAEECWALRRGSAHRMRHTNDMRCAHWQEESEFRSICVPMMALGDTVGMLFVQVADGAEHDGLFETDSLELASTVAAQVASSMANLTLRAALHQQSVKDPLTGLFNRRYLEESLKREAIRASRSGAPLTVIMADIDHFKEFNDVHGHQAGDQVLQRFAAELVNRVRGEDLACRFGGEEFTLVLPGADLAMGVERAEEVRAAVSQISANFKGTLLPTITASFGVACFPTHGDEPAAVVHHADQALLRAKRGGRNRVVAAD